MLAFYSIRINDQWLSLYFGNTPEFWMNLQTHYDLKIARRELPAADRKRIHANRAA